MADKCIVAANCQCFYNGLFIYNLLKEDPVSALPNSQQVFCFFFVTGEISEQRAFLFLCNNKLCIILLLERTSAHSRYKVSVQL